MQLLEFLVVFHDIWLLLFDLFRQTVSSSVQFCPIFPRNEKLKSLKPDSKDSRISETEVDFTDLSSHGYVYGLLKGNKGGRRTRRHIDCFFAGTPLTRT